MKPENISHISEFILLGFSEEPEVQSLVFVLFLSIYLITVLGNLLIILAISSDPRLHTPVYFFLCNLSLVDICVTSNTIPILLVSIQTQNKSITYEYCFTQMVFFLLLSGLEVSFLTVMAYDRFVAICHPLNYTVIMNPRICGLLLLGSWAMSILDCLLHSLMTLTLSFCSEVFIPNFFCEPKQMVQLSCSDTFVNDVVMYAATLLVGGGSLSGILYSYSKIVSSIYRITSVQGKYKAFSTCASHLSVVSLFYCTVMGAYLSSAAAQTPLSSSITSAMYTVATPMLNPFIYSLQNK